mgnify:CR=1 FL=1
MQLLACSTLFLVEIYDPNKVGKRISWGRSHFIYHYDEREVIKFPTFDVIAWGDNLRARYERDYSVAKQYLGEYMLDTRIVQHPTRNRIATIQPFVSGHYLSKADLGDPSIKQQFDEFIVWHQAMIDAGYEQLDLIGQGGVLQRRLSNIMVTSDKTLRLFDILIGDTFGMVRFQRFALWLRVPVYARQASTIRYLQS